MTHIVDDWRREDGFGWFVEWTLEDNPCWIDLKVFEVVSVGDDGPGYQLPNLRHTSNRSEAAPLVTGYVKWDGCSEMDANPHWCRHEDVKRYADLLVRLHARAGELLGGDEDYFGPSE